MDIDLCIPEPLVEIVDEGLVISLGIAVVPNNSWPAGHVLGHCQKV